MLPVNLEEQECSVSLIAFDVRRTQHLILEFLGYPGVHGVELFGMIFSSCVRILVDFLQSAFSLKIRLVLISSSAIANHDVIITETRREKTDLLTLL